MSALVKQLPIDELLRLCEQAAKQVNDDGEEPSDAVPFFGISPEQAAAISQLARDYRALRGLVDGQSFPSILYHGVWPEQCRCKPPCNLPFRCRQQQVGHYLYTRAGRHLSTAESRAFGVPTFARSLDGGYAPGSDEKGYSPKLQPDRMVRVTHEQGWTLFGLWDRSGDQRGNSNSVIVVQGTWEFKDLERLALHALPLVWGRIKDGIREESPAEWERARRMALGGEF